MAHMGEGNLLLSEGFGPEAYLHDIAVKAFTDTDWSTAFNQRYIGP